MVMRLAAKYKLHHLETEVMREFIYIVSELHHLETEVMYELRV